MEKDIIEYVKTFSVEKQKKATKEVPLAEEEEEILDKLVLELVKTMLRKNKEKQ